MNKEKKDGQKARKPLTALLAYMCHLDTEFFLPKDQAKRDEKQGEKPKRRKKIAQKKREGFRLVS